MENKRRDFLKTACAPVVFSMFGISVSLKLVVQAMTMVMDQHQPWSENGSIPESTSHCKY